MGYNSGGWKSGVVQFAPSATIKDYPEIDLFGYMKTTAKGDEQKGGAATRSAVARLSNAIALEPFQGNLEFLTNMGLAVRGNLEMELRKVRFIVLITHILCQLIWTE